METSPEVEVSDASVENALAAAFEKAGMKDTPEKEPVDQPDEQEAEAEDDGETAAEATTDDPEDSPSDTAEVEIDGEIYALPVKIKDGYLRQQDYTKKTQEVAERRKAVDEQAAQVESRAKFIDAHADKIAEAKNLHDKLQQYAQVNWRELAETNSAQYLVLDREQRMLSEAQNRVVFELQHLEQGFRNEQTQAKQKAQAKCIEEVKRTFKVDGPELNKFLGSLDETGKSFGFSGEELATIADPRMVRVLHAAMQYQKLQASKPLTEKKVQDARPVQVKAARSAQTSQANATLVAARDRLKKTGKSSDAEAFLAARFAKAKR